MQEPPPPPDADAGADAVTGAYRAWLAENPAPPGGALLAQTAAVGPLRRMFVPTVPLRPGWRVLDVGTGFGPLAFELARRHPVQVTGADRDGPVLGVARRLAAGLAGNLAAGSSVDFVQAPAEALPFADRTFDLVTASLLFQHLADPEPVVDEMRRVLRPGGHAFVFDVDDGLGATYPDAGPLSRLEAAFAASQALAGGDRQVGRKLSVTFAEHGFVVDQILLVPQAQHVRTAPDGELRALTVARLRAARSGIVGADFLDTATFDGLLDAYESSPAREICRIEAQVALIAGRPSEPGGSGAAGVGR